MRHLLLFILAILTSSIVIGQNIKFKKSYGNHGFDYGRSVIQLRDSSYLVTGSSSSYNINSADAFIMHVDSLGTLLNTNFYGGSATEWGEKITIGVDSSYAVTGYTNSIGEGGFDFYFFKTDVNKSLIVEKSYGGSEWDFAYDLLPVADSGYILVGETNSFGAIGMDTYMVRIDKNGDTIWTQKYGDTGEDEFRAIQAINSTEFIVCGTYKHPDSTHTDGIIRRMNIDGSIIWEKYYGTTFNDELYGLDTAENKILVAGARGKINSEFDAWGMQIDFDGNFVWQYATTNANSFYGRDICGNTNVGNYFMAMETNSSDIPAYSGGGFDILKGSFNLSDGYINFNIFKHYGGIGEDFARGIIATSDDGVMLVGSANNYSTGGSNVILIKSGKDFGTVDNANWTTDSILEIHAETYVPFQNQLYPNPNRGSFTIESQEHNLHVEIYDINAKLVYTNTLSFGTNQINTGLLKGIYFASILNDEHHREIIKIVIH